MYTNYKIVLRREVAVKFAENEMMKMNFHMADYSPEVFYGKMFALNMFRKRILSEHNKETDMGGRALGFLRLFMPEYSKSYPDIIRRDGYLCQGFFLGVQKLRQEIFDYYERNYKVFGHENDWFEKCRQMEEYIFSKPGTVKCPL